MAEVHFDIGSILFLIASVQGLFLGVMILIRRPSANHMLAGLILSFSLMLLFYVSYWTGFNKQVSPIFGLAQGFTLLLGPLLYFYLRSKPKDIYFKVVHLIPFLIYVAFFMYLPWAPVSIRPQILLGQTILQISHLACYTILAFLYLGNLGNLTNGALKLKRWHSKIAWAFAGYAISFILYFVMVWSKTIKVEYDYMISAASTFFIYFIGYNGFQKPEVLKMNETARYNKSALGTDASQAILKEVKNYFESRQPYLKSNLKLTDVAAELKYSIHIISQVINEHEGKSFNDFVNTFRIELAKRLLRENPSLKIIHVAFDSGFNNKASFNNAFKKNTGLLPSEYRDSQIISAEGNPIG